MGAGGIRMIERSYLPIVFSQFEVKAMNWPSFEIVGLGGLRPSLAAVI